MMKSAMYLKVLYSLLFVGEKLVRDLILLIIMQELSLRLVYCRIYLCNNCNCVYAFWNHDMTAFQAMYLYAQKVNL